MIACYKNLLYQCPLRSYFRERVNFIRVMFSVRAVRDVLCGNKSTGLQEIMRWSACIESARRYGTCDDHLSPDREIHLLTFFNQMMRFQISDDACQPLANFKKCLVKNARINECASSAIAYAEQSLDQWIYHFCERAGIHVNNHSVSILLSRTNSLFLLLFTLIPILISEL